MSNYVVTMQSLSLQISHLFLARSSLTCRQLYPANIHLDEDVLKTSFVFVFRRRLEDVFKTSLSRQICSPEPYVFRRRLQNVFKISWSRPMYSPWLYVFKTSSRPTNVCWVECGFILKCVCYTIRTYSQMHCTDKCSQHSSII